MRARPPQSFYSSSSFLLLLPLALFSARVFSLSPVLLLPTLVRKLKSTARSPCVAGRSFFTIRPRVSTCFGCVLPRPRPPSVAIARLHKAHCCLSLSIVWSPFTLVSLVHDFLLPVSSYSSSSESNLVFRSSFSCMLYSPIRVMLLPEVPFFSLFIVSILISSSAGQHARACPSRSPRLPLPHFRPPTFWSVPPRCFVILS